MGRHAFVYASLVDENNLRREDVSKIPDILERALKIKREIDIQEGCLMYGEALDAASSGKETEP